MNKILPPPPRGLPIHSAPGTPVDQRWSGWFASLTQTINNDSMALTVTTLPSNPYQFQRSWVTDATATTFASIVAGGGTNKVPVYYDGANWRIG
jgi:hypothetical protein